MASSQLPNSGQLPNEHLMKAELFQAAKNGSVDKFKATLANPHGTIVSSHTRHRKDTLLHIAALFGHRELSTFLTEQYPHLITCKNFIGDTPLHVAARAGKLLVVTDLASKEVPHKDSLLAVNEDGNTPLHEAVIHKRDEIVEFLLRTLPDFKDVFVVNKKGKSPLYLAVESGNAQIVKKILNLSGGTSQNGVTEHDETRKFVLHAAITGIDIGNTQNLKNISNPSGSTGTSQIGVNEHVETKKYVLNVAITGKDEDKKSLIVEVENGQNSKNILNLLGCSCPSQIGDAEHVETTEPVLHAAVIGKDIGILEMVAEKVLKPLPDVNNNLLHLAASLGFLNGVKCLLRKFSMDVLRCDKNGFCPIHLAAKHGHLQVIQELLGHYPDAREFLSDTHQNILHIAAENGKDNIVQYILKTEWAEFLMNDKDEGGYTPLHLATKNWHPKVVSTLTWDTRVNLKLVNKEGLTALEVAEKYMEEMAPFKKRLTWMALMSAGPTRAQIKDADTVKRLQAAKYEPYNMDYCKDRVNTLLLVSALVATVTFAAGFTMPGGNKSSGSKHDGMASMILKTRFQLFVIFDSIAVYSSIIVAVMLMWAQLGDLNLLLNALRMAQRLLGLSLTMMCLAFVTGVDLVVTELQWLSIVILVMGSLSLITLLALFVPLFLPYTSKSIFFRYISYYPFKLLMLASES